MMDLEAALASDLAGMAAQLYPYNLALAEQEAWRRITRLVKASPIILAMLAEPWLEELREPAGATYQKLLLCSRLHLYSRVLDDAVDEGLECQKQALLRVQPLFWDCVARLGELEPRLTKRASKVVTATITAVLDNDRCNSPSYWGAKNGHLLLIPLYLGCDVAFFETAWDRLLLCLAILQAGDEFRQGSFRDVGAFCQLVTCAMANVGWLAEHGWPVLAKKICLDSEKLLNYLEK